ncbi:hypothetical protein ABCR94_37630 [Streptomyces sp. 21So2-11]|uniref:hypothetical protein n=1 Tax=Streptomyces sp. 21So2-11 TaxID=3144408 RepID=UPI00321BE349
MLGDQITHHHRVDHRRVRHGGLLLLVGAYVAHYGWYEIRVQGDAATQDAAIGAASALQRTIADTLEGSGPAIPNDVVALLATGLGPRSKSIRRQRQR